MKKKVNDGQLEACVFASVCRYAPENCGKCLLNRRSGAALKDAIDGEKALKNEKGFPKCRIETRQ